MKNQNIPNGRVEKTRNNTSNLKSNYNYCKKKKMKKNFINHLRNYVCVCLFEMCIRKYILFLFLRYMILCTQEALLPNYRLHSNSFGQNNCLFYFKHWYFFTEWWQNISFLVKTWRISFCYGHRKFPFKFTNNFQLKYLHSPETIITLLNLNSHSRNWSVENR